MGANIKFLIFTIFGVIALFGCDKERRKECEWLLIPDETRIGKVDEGYIPVCARNFKSNKQDCRLQATLDFAREAYNKKFKYTNLRVDGPGTPRTVKKIKFCQN